MSEQFPNKIIIVGAGIFGLSTALAIVRRHPLTQVTIIDRLTPPVVDGTSVDTTRCIRSGIYLSLRLLLEVYRELSLHRLCRSNLCPTG